MGRLRKPNTPRAAVAAAAVLALAAGGAAAELTRPPDSGATAPRATAAANRAAEPGGEPSTDATGSTTTPDHAADDTEKPTTAPDQTPDATDPTTPAKLADRDVRVWFTSGEQFKSEERAVATDGSIVRRTLEELLRGPTESETADNVDTQIPKGVTLRSYEVTDDMVAEVGLTPGFLKGVPSAPGERDAEDQATLKARLGQVTYTVTQFGHIKRARISAGDQVLAAFDREDYRAPDAGPESPTVDPGPPVAGTREAQQALANRGYLPPSAVDGQAGDRTKQAVLAFQAWEGLARDGVIGPKTTAQLEDSSRPEPRGDGRRIEVYRSKGVALAVRGGRLVRALHVSTGKAGYATPAGTYEVFRKERRSWSVPFSAWLPWASYFNRGIAFHEWPSVPAYPASHGCVRIAPPDAKWLYGFADVHTEVVVY